MNMALLRAVSIALVTSFSAVIVEADSDRNRHGKSNREHDRHQDYRGDHNDHKKYHNSHVHHGYHHKSSHQSHWKNGYWHHGHRHGRDGWWWIAAGIWHWYPRPVYPYPAYDRVVVVDRPQPAPVVVQNNTPFWYYCDSARNYYPHVSSCPEGWRAIPTQPRDLN